MFSSPVALVRSVTSCLELRRRSWGCSIFPPGSGPLQPWRCSSCRDSSFPSGWGRKVTQRTWGVLAVQSILVTLPIEAEIRIWVSILPHLLIQSRPSIPHPSPGHSSAAGYLGKSLACSSGDEHSPGHLISSLPKGSEMIPGAAAPARVREEPSQVCGG